MSGKWVGIPDKLYSVAQLVRIKTFSDGQLLRIGNLSVKPYHFTDKMRL